MGWLFGRGKKTRARIDMDFEIGMSFTIDDISHNDALRLQSGWKMDAHERIHPPDTVWVGPRSKVYHCRDYCCGAIIAADGIRSMTERKAISLGYRKCQRCDWDYNPFDD